MLSLSVVKDSRKLKMFIFLASVFIFIMLWAVIQPLSVSPDEEMRYQIVEFIIRHGCLPDGRDPEIQNQVWGISYAYYPILSYMIMAIPAKLISLFTTQSFAVLLAARTVNALFGTIMAYLTFRISEMLFNDKVKYLFTCLVVFLPEVIFIHSYVNNDSMALLSTAWITYVWVRSIKEGWTRSLCIHLALAISMCTLSYYNAYGFILSSIVFFFTTILIGTKMPRKGRYVASRTILIIAIVLALALWWFVRNYILYKDPTGWNITTEYAEKYAIDGFKPSQRLNLAKNGVNALQLMVMPSGKGSIWIAKVACSFVGTFGNMDLFMPVWHSAIYIGIFAIGFIGLFTCLGKTFAFKLKTEKGKEPNRMAPFNYCMLLVIFITFSLLIYYNLYSDFQPQGRYLLPMVIPFMYFVAIGIKRAFEKLFKKESTRGRAYILLSAFLVISVIYIYATVFYPAYVC